jgi:hypothetical protein
MLEVKINHLRTTMQKSNNLPNIDMIMVRIQALEWVQAQIQDLILDNVTTDWPVKNGKVDRTKGIDEVINNIDIYPSDQM